MIYKNEKYKRRRTTTTKLHKWEKTTLKTILKTLLSGNSKNIGYL